MDKLTEAQQARLDEVTKDLEVSWVDTQTKCWFSAELICKGWHCRLDFKEDGRYAIVPLGTNNRQDRADCRAFWVDLLPIKRIYYSDTHSEKFDPALYQAEYQAEYEGLEVTRDIVLHAMYESRVQKWYHKNAPGTPQERSFAINSRKNLITHYGHFKPTQSDRRVVDAMDLDELKEFITTHKGVLE